MADVDVSLALIDGGAGDTCASILAELPEWFGIPESNTDYIEAADREPSVIASVDGQPVGITTLVTHSPEAAEVYLMAVRPALHRQGLGVAMLEFLERHLADTGVKFLQVKTLADGHPDPGYEKTRKFYRAYGFLELETFPTLWDPANPAMQLIKVVGE